MLTQSIIIRLYLQIEGASTRPNETVAEFSKDLIEQMETIKRLNPKEKISPSFNYSSPALVMYSGVGGDISNITPSIHSRIQILMAMYLDGFTLVTILREAREIAQGKQGMFDYSRYSKEYNIPLIGRKK